MSILNFLCGVLLTLSCVICSQGWSLEEDGNCSTWNGGTVPVNGSGAFSCSNGFQPGNRQCSRYQFHFNSNRWVSEGSASENGCFDFSSGNGYCVQGCPQRNFASPAAAHLLPVGPGVSSALKSGEYQSDASLSADGASFEMTVDVNLALNLTLTRSYLWQQQTDLGRSVYFMSNDLAEALGGMCDWSQQNIFNGVTGTMTCQRIVNGQLIQTLDGQNKYVNFVGMTQVLIGGDVRIKTTITGGFAPNLFTQFTIHSIDAKHIQISEDQSTDGGFTFGKHLSAVTLHSK